MITILNRFDIWCGSHILLTRGLAVLGNTEQDCNLSPQSVCKFLLTNWNLYLYQRQNFRNAKNIMSALWFWTHINWVPSAKHHSIQNLSYGSPSQKCILHPCHMNISLKGQYRSYLEAPDMWQTNIQMSIHGKCNKTNSESIQLHVLTVVKIKINVQDTAELLSQFVNSKDYIIDVTESLSLISSETNGKLQSISVLVTYTWSVYISEPIAWDRNVAKCELLATVFQLGRRCTPLLIRVGCVDILKPF